MIASCYEGPVWPELPDMRTRHFCPSWCWWFVGIGDLLVLVICWYWWFVGYSHVYKSLYCSQIARKAKSLEIKYFSETWRQEAAAVALLNICSPSHILIKMKRFSRDTLCVKKWFQPTCIHLKKKQIFHSNTFFAIFDDDSLVNKWKWLTWKGFVCRPAFSVWECEDQVSCIELQFSNFICDHTFNSTLYIYFYM